MNRRRARGTPLSKTNRAIIAEVSLGVPLFALRRAVGPPGHGSVSAIELPSGGTKAVARTISRTRDAPSLVNTPGAVSPAIECATITTSFTSTSHAGLGATRRLPGCCGGGSPRASSSPTMRRHSRSIGCASRTRPADGAISSAPSAPSRWSMTEPEVCSRTSARRPRPRPTDSTSPGRRRRTCRRSGDSRWRPA